MAVSAALLCAACSRFRIWFNGELYRSCSLPLNSAAVMSKGLTASCRRAGATRARVPLRIIAATMASTKAAKATQMKNA